MTRIPLRALRRALRPRRTTPPPVHFHNGPQDTPAVCFDESCRRPRLDVG
jgi:hypothetical protein